MRSKGLFLGMSLVAMLSAVGAGAGVSVAEINRLQNENTEKTAVVRTLTEENKDLKSDLATANASLLSVNTELTSTRATLATVNANLVTANENLASERTAKAELQTRLDAEVLAKTALQTELNTANAEKVRLQEQIDEKDTNIAGLTAQIQAKDAEIAAKIARVLELEAQIEDLTNFKYGRYVWTEQLQNGDFDDVYIEVMDNGKVKFFTDAEHFVELDYVQDGNTITLNFVENGEVYPMEFTLTSNTSFVNTNDETMRFVYCDEDLADVLASRQALQSDLRTVKNDKSILQINLDAANATIVDLNSQISSKDVTIESLNTQLADKDVSIALYQNTVASLTEEKTALHTRVDELTSEVARLQTRIAELESQTTQNGDYQISYEKRYMFISMNMGFDSHSSSSARDITIDEYFKSTLTEQCYFTYFEKQNMILRYKDNRLVYTDEIYDYPENISAQGNCVVNYIFVDKNTNEVININQLEEGTIIKAYTNLSSQNFEISYYTQNEITELGLELEDGYDRLIKSCTVTVPVSMDTFEIYCEDRTLLDPGTSWIQRPGYTEGVNFEDKLIKVFTDDYAEITFRHPYQDYVENQGDENLRADFEAGKYGYLRVFVNGVEQHDSTIRLSANSGERLILEAYISKNADGESSILRTYQSAEGHFVRVYDTQSGELYVMDSIYSNSLYFALISSREEMADGLEYDVFDLSGENYDDYKLVVTNNDTVEIRQQDWTIMEYNRVLTQEEIITALSTSEVLNYAWPCDIELTQTIEITRDITINLNGHTIRGANIDGAVFRVHEGATLIIEGEGSVIGGSGADCHAIEVQGRLVIHDGNYSVGPDADGLGNSTIYASADGAEIEIYGGTFSSDAAWNDFYYVLNLKNSISANVSVYGGAFAKYNPALGDDNLGGNFVAEGYEVIQDGDNYIVQ